MLIGLVELYAFDNTLRTPATSNIARIAPPAMIPVPEISNGGSEGGGPRGSSWLFVGIAMMAGVGRYQHLENGQMCVPLRLLSRHDHRVRRMKIWLHVKLVIIVIQKQSGVGRLKLLKHQPRAKKVITAASRLGVVGQLWP